MICNVTNSAPVIPVSSVTPDNKPRRLPPISIIIYHILYIPQLLDIDKRY